jgi:hypothetical protein
VPLLDHFHPPLSEQRHWESFHTTWASALADALNEDWLPPGYFAEEQVTAGGRVEIDVATFDAGQAEEAPAGGVATVSPPRLWTVPAPTFAIPAVELEEFSIRIYNSEGGPKLVAAIELASPANKDWPESRRAFVTKCAAYLYQRISLLIVDIVDVVTSRMAELHRDLLQMLGQPDAPSAPLFAAAYRPTFTSSPPIIEGWFSPLRVGNLLPTLPLYIAADYAAPVNLEATYNTALQRRRILG